MQSVINKVTGHDTHNINAFDQEDVPQLRGRVHVCITNSEKLPLIRGPLGRPQSLPAAP